MAINSVNTNTLQAAGVNLQDFMKILTTQLMYQDPLKPMDNQEFVAQMAQFTNLEVSRQLNDKMAQLLAVQSANQSIGLLGKSVGVSLESGTNSGKVTAINLASNPPQLTVTLAGGQVLTGISLSQITTVQ